MFTGRMPACGILSGDDDIKYIAEMLAIPCPNCGGQLEEGERHESMCRLYCKCGCSVRLSSYAEPVIKLPTKPEEQ